MHSLTPRPRALDLEQGTHSSLILDLDDGVPCCLTTQGELLVADVPSKAASTNRTVLRLYTRAFVDREYEKEIPALGVMEGTILALCEVNGVVLCLARLNSSTDGRLSLVSMSRRGQRHRCWLPGIDNLVGLEPSEEGAGVLLVDKKGRRWGVVDNLGK